MEPRIVVIGGSAGSFDALLAIVQSLPPEVPAAIIIVVHSAPRQRSYLPAIVNSRCKLAARLVSEGDRLHAGEIYICPPDRHLVIARDHFHLSRGPKEGLHRPSINVTFRSAAMTYGDRVIGVILSGMLDDGAAGIWEIANHGGTTIIQDPDEAIYPSMPLNALRDSRIDYQVRSAEIGRLISRLASDETMFRPGNPQEDEGERVFSGFTCPECRGPLFEFRSKGPVEFKCRVGHLISLATLLDEHSSTQERKLYEAIVALDEGAELAAFAADRMEGVDVESLRREAEQLRIQAETIRRIIEERIVASLE